MLNSATYICPVKGVAGLEPPEPTRLGQSARAAKSLGIERLLLPVIEESLSGTTRAKVRFLDGLIQSMDQIAGAGVTAWLIAPAQRILGLDFAPPHLVKSARDPQAGPVFVDGGLRNVRPLNWWSDPTVIQKRIKIFREIITAVNGHPALTGWLIMDRALEWSRPELGAADLVLKSYLAEIRERDESGIIYIGLGWSELLEPEVARALVSQVDGVRLSGLENLPPGLDAPEDETGELLLTAYLGTLAEWLFHRPTEVEIGWRIFEKGGDPQRISDAIERLGHQGATGSVWLSLIDPEPKLHTLPPWCLRRGLEKVALFHYALEPKNDIEAWLKEIVSRKPLERANDFIDLSVEEYLKDPHSHLPRLWDHFRESL